MALQATHFRIAFDLAKHKNLRIGDFSSYYAGTMYPDSRYATGIAREQTHGSHCPHDLLDPTLSDFQLGWAIHLLYDEISGEMQKALMPSGLILSQERNYAWAYFTAIKVVEDLFSVEAMKEHIPILAKLSIDQAPNNESLEALQSYYTKLDTLYGKGAPTLDHYSEPFQDYDTSPQILRDIIDISSELMKDEVIRKTIDDIYIRTILEILEMLQSR